MTLATNPIQPGKTYQASLETSSSICLWQGMESMPGQYSKSERNALAAEILRKLLEEAEKTDD